MHVGRHRAHAFARRGRMTTTVSVAILTCIVNRVDRLGPPAGLSARYWNGSDERLRNLVRVRSMSCAWDLGCGLHRRPIATRSIS
jgi:hypothetical protein